MTYSPDQAASSSWSDPERSQSDSELLDLLCLSLVPGVGPLTSQALLEHFGTAGRVLDASSKKLREVQGVGPKLASRLASARREFDPAEELALCRREGVMLLGTGYDQLPSITPRHPRPTCAPVRQRRLRAR